MKNKLKKLMSERGLTASALSSATGIGKSSLSQYLSGKNVPRGKNVEKLAAALDVSAETLTNGDTGALDTGSAGRLSVAAAAKLMGVNAQFIRVGLQQGKFPFGFAMKCSEGSQSFSYYISPKLFEEYTGIEVPKEAI